MPDGSISSSRLTFDHAPSSAPSIEQMFSQFLWLSRRRRAADEAAERLAREILESAPVPAALDRFADGTPALNIVEFVTLQEPHGVFATSDGQAYASKLRACPPYADMKAKSADGARMENDAGELFGRLRDTPARSLADVVMKVRAFGVMAGWDVADEDVSFGAELLTVIERDAAALTV